MNDIIVTIILTVVVSGTGIYYSRKNNEAFSFRLSIYLIAIGFYYLSLRFIGEFFGYNLLYFLLLTLLYCAFLYGISLLIKGHKAKNKENTYLKN